jgi:hypothetical protein
VETKENILNIELVREKDSPSSTITSDNYAKKLSDMTMISEVHMLLEFSLENSDNLQSSGKEGKVINMGSDDKKTI